MLKSAIFAVTTLAFAVPAFADTTFTATLETPVVEKERVVANSAVWTCVDATCVADLRRSSVTVRVCKKFVKEAGAVTAFATDEDALDEDDLASCNRVARG